MGALLSIPSPVSAVNRQQPPGFAPARLRKDPAVRAILLHWRRLTQGNAKRPERGTLIACSGGADSCALVLALAAAGNGPNTGRLVIGHVVHDLRSERDSLSDRDAVRALAESLGLEFAEARVRVRSAGGNLEARAREARYGALAEMACERGLPFVAVAHHADDQLETVLMSFLRGTGGVGIRGMRPKRPIGPTSDIPHPTSHIHLIRPMLTEGAIVDREACRRICELGGVAWREDATNADTSRLRAAIRHRIVPVLRELRPDVGRRAIVAAAFSAASQKRLGRAAALLLDSANPANASETHAELSWPRQKLRRVDPIMLGELLRRAQRTLRGPKGADRLTKRVIDAAVRAIRDENTEPRRIVVGSGGGVGGMNVDVTARRVVMNVF